MGQEACSHAANFEEIVIDKGKSVWDLRVHCDINYYIFCISTMCFVRT